MIQEKAGAAYRQPYAQSSQSSSAADAGGSSVGLLLLGHVPEGGDHLVMQRHEGFLEVLLRLAGHLELHVRNLLDNVLHVVVDGVPANLLFARELSHGL
eukprot:CAMPEP_0203958932 /NCGR_PEP_ID=MMETSP0359-20131031/90193_1 /ASSEMBLY_ACC=CAM_ASM_000338 /TAXON_ID=268821 /ORGANISM="Scrippsiella Hangoei, Strain SHTV-5" /LENGTH=98 /DNA_ID=CAMNT_0050892951 /DNA_START=50 /DNA_END=343 /DNA_ORIENTATION=-